MSARKTVDASSKGLEITSQMLKFGLGLAIAVLVIFSFVWYFLNDQYTRTARQNTATLVQAFDVACQSGQEPVNLHFNLPQEIGFKGTLYEKLGISGGNAGNYPFFSVYVGNFPQESYSTLILYYWAEDEPWSSNLLLTATLDAAMGLPLGNKITDSLGKALRTATKVALVGKEIIIFKMVGGLNKGIRFSFSTIKDGLEKGIESLKFSKSIKLAELNRIADESIDELALKQNLIHADIATEVSGRLRVNSEYEDALKELLKDPSYQSKFFDFEYDDKGMLKAAYVNLQEGLASIKNPIKNIFLKINKLGYEQVLSKSKSQELLDLLKRYTPEQKVELYDKLGFKTSFWESVKGRFSPDEIVRIKNDEVNTIIRNLQNDLDTGALILVPKESSLNSILETHGDEAISAYLDEVSKDPKEALLLRDLFERKVLRVPENVENLKPEFGYLLLRVQDFYTPANPTYLANFLGSQVSPTQCGPNQLCLKYGFKVDSYPLDETSCFGKIKEIKLRRDEVKIPPIVGPVVVPKDPPFYLVSPCFADLTIQKEGDTLYVEPKICKNKPTGFAHIPNYCYATSGLVNFYVNEEAITAFAPLLDLVLPYSGQVAQFLLDMFREGVINYPFSYEGILADQLRGDTTC